MAKNNISSVISIDSNSKIVSLGVLNNGAMSVADRAKCEKTAYGNELFDSIGSVIKGFREKHKDISFQETWIILPDELFFNDAVSVPLISKRAIGRSVQLAIGAIYKNVDELVIKTFLLSQNKQYATYGLVGIRRDILSAVQRVCIDAGVETAGISPRSVCLASGALAKTSGNKKDTFLFLNIKKDISEFVFVLEGQMVGCYSLPVGCSILDNNSCVSERLLFEHSSAELLVGNAKRRARSEWDADLADERESGVIGYENAPCDTDECACMNFRIFVKWALELIANNKTLLLSKPIDTVYVNMPSEYGYLLEMINAEKDENNVEFVRLSTESGDASLSESIELYGGLCIDRHNKTIFF